MKFFAFGRVLISFCLLVCRAPLSNGQNNVPKKISLLPVTPGISAAAAKALDGIEPRGTRAIGGINKNGAYVLSGDLFGNGDIYGIIDNTDNVILCEWTHRAWHAKSYIDVNPVWKFPGWNRDTAWTREPSASKPFWMLPFEGYKLLVIATEVEKAGQDYSLLLFDRAADKILDDCDSFSCRPLIRAGYILTEDSSRVKSEMEVTYISRIENGKFVLLASDKDLTPYRQPDPGTYSSEVIKFGEKSYTILDDYSGRDHPADMVVFEGDIDGWEEIANAWKSQKPFAELYFSPIKNLSEGDKSQFPGSESSYVFEKLTGLPRSLWDSETDYTIDEHKVSPMKIERMTRVRVVGSPEAVRLLLPGIPR